MKGAGGLSHQIFKTPSCCCWGLVWVLLAGVREAMVIVWVENGLNARPLEKQSLNLSIRRHLWIVFLEIIVESDNALQLYKVSAILDAV